MFLNGVNLNVKVMGSGPAIVALHGFAGSMSTWDDFVHEARRKYKIIVVDLLGHGGSDSPCDPLRYQVERSGSDIAAILDTVGVAGACWVGYSMGGRIALLTATRMPERFSCLVLESVSPGLISQEDRAQRARSDGILARRITDEGVEAFSRFWEHQPLFATQKSLPREVRERIRNQRLRNSPVGLANALRGAGSGVQQPVHESLPFLKIPVLCITGEYDNKFTAIAKDICNKLPNGRLSIIPGAGHAPHIEKPSAFNKAVLAFLEESNPRTWTPQYEARS